jgi:hypothetical protein
MSTVDRPPPPAEPARLGTLVAYVPGHALVSMEDDRGHSLRLHRSVLPREPGRSLTLHHPRVGLVGLVTRVPPARRRRYCFACPGWAVRVVRTRPAAPPPRPRPTEGQCP